MEKIKNLDATPSWYLFNLLFSNLLAPLVKEPTVPSTSGLSITRMHTTVQTSLELLKINNHSKNKTMLSKRNTPKSVELSGDYATTHVGKKYPPP
jgi:hypothetical protein